jgi:iron complex outermembrane receptor protein
MSCRPKFFGVSSIRSAIALCFTATPLAWADHIPPLITITAEPPVRVSDFDGVSIQDQPLSVTSIGHATLRDISAQRVTDALKTDASVTDSYNLPAYWDTLSVRGFTLDNRANYRREGLPISAESIIPMDNKQRIELLKGTSGMQSGTSAPGGLVNYVVKRAPNSSEKAIRDVTMSYGAGSNQLIAGDLGGRFGEDSNFGYRFNVAHEELNPYIRDTKGHRDLVALAMDWRIDSSNRIEWEFEQSHHEQIGVNFYSLLGAGTNALPAPVDGTRNITRQPNSQPTIFDGLTGSMSFKHQLDNGWLWNTQYGLQRLRTDDRLTYASGCDTGPADRFCTNGDFKIHDYRSENEHRNSESVQTDLRGQVLVSGIEHNLKFGLLRHRQSIQNPYAATDTLLGTTNANYGGLTPINAAPNYWISSNNNDYSTEISANDRVRLAEQTNLWIGLRHTQLTRQSIQTDGGHEVKDARNISTPWLAISQQINTHNTIYLSQGYGLEAVAAPNQSSFTNKGQPLPALRSTQREIGLKSQLERTYIQVAWFDIKRPVTTDGTTCKSDTPDSCTRQIDGQAHHQGVELSTLTKLSQWSFGGSAMWLDARRENATVAASLNGQSPINVPKFIMRGTMEYRHAYIPGLRSSLRLSHEGERNVTETGDIKIPAWTTLDATAHYDTKIHQLTSSWMLSVNNLMNKHYWRESPYQHNQYFLYPGAPRTLRATVVFHL